MGKYMRKSKTASEVALLDISHTQSSLGVRTRAKTLALQRLQRSTAAAPGTTSSGCGDCGSYMQLRSRRLQKPPIGSQPRRHKPAPKDSNPSPKANQNQNKSSRASSKLRQVSSANSRSVNKGDECLDDEKKEDNILQESNVGVEKTENNVNNGDDIAVEGSFGENLPDFEGRERTTRESTPISLIRDPDAIPTPGSSTRRTSTNQAHRRVQNSPEGHIPTIHEMNEFFSGAEEQQQREFIEKYNYDPVNDRPLPGRFEWQKIDP
ncbi:cyclin-dependent kinase inhibitor 3-like [Ipomoea triloba]|uniref:cyclin-dependent kinase inhibitor 3-like n=1 Tax=Ipomoea triloba TaxID=35885 RepID=UPI00125E7FA3|nr:cyclin-dependent kinase inhibitor 3-like [Ipomoea triloba]